MLPPLQGCCCLPEAARWVPPGGSSCAPRRQPPGLLGPPSAQQHSRGTQPHHDTPAALHARHGHLGDKNAHETALSGPSSAFPPTRFPNCSASFYGSLAHPHCARMPQQAPPIASLPGSKRGRCTAFSPGSLGREPARAARKHCDHARASSEPLTVARCPFWCLMWGLAKGAQ